MASTCRHADVREFDGLRSCLACGETSFRGDESEVLDVASIQEQEYMYSDLRCLESGQMIRLVVLHPGRYEDPIHCTIILAGLHSEYEAVSYTWATENGDDSKSEPIYVDRNLIRVTKNCAAALRCLRAEEKTRRLWIDAISINQANIHERNHQVGLMDKIYRNALTVHVCIFDPGRTYSACIQALITDYGMLDHTETCQLRDLFQTRYFSRAWVVQEVALARAVVLHVNNDIVEMTRERIGIMQDIRFSPSKTDIPGPFVSLLGVGSSQSIIQRLSVSMSLQCSDPRDLVYATLSLLNPSIRVLIPIDYSLSEENVLANAIVACIVECGDLSILSFVSLTRRCRGFAMTAADKLGLVDIKDPATSVDKWDWQNASSLTTEAFLQFLTWKKNSTERPLIQKTTAHRLYCSWRPYVLLEIAGSRTEHSSNVQSIPRTRALVQRLDHPLSPHTLLPCLRVHAHMVDRSKGHELMDFNQFVQLSLDHVRHKSAGFKGLFSALTEHIPEARGFETCHTPDQHLAVHLKACKIYLRRNHRNHDETYIGDAEIFLTSRSIGFSASRSLPGDLICLIDGNKDFFLIRQVRDDVFRIVGVCFLLPAFQLVFHDEHTRNWLHEHARQVRVTTEMVTLY